MGTRFCPSEIDSAWGEGDTLHLLSAIEGMPEEYAYFWRRLCVIACEDVGPAMTHLLLL